MDTSRCWRTDEPLDVSGLPSYTAGVDPTPDWDYGPEAWALSLMWGTNYYAWAFPLPAKRNKHRYGR